MSSSNKTHLFHIIDPSPWPILVSLSLFLMTFSGAMMMHEYRWVDPILYIGAAGLVYFLYRWWSDVIKEGMVDKAHTSLVRNGLSLGMVLFIVSEIMFFAVFFGSFFNAWLNPADILEGIWPITEGIWPPKGTVTFDPWDLPLINTIILLLSGSTVTWAHYALMEDNHEEMIEALGYTVLLGALFSLFQAFEYSHAEFKFTDGIYASNFYMATGFHGMHVLVGTIFLSVCYFRAKKGHFKNGNGHLGFEFAAWYWHFVDVVWLFLYIFLYILAR